MNQVLLNKPFPGATTCVLLGQPEAGLVAELERYRHVLWLTDASGMSAAPTGQAARTFQPVVVDALPTREIAPLVTRFLGRDARHLPSLLITQSVLSWNPSLCDAVIAEIHATFDDQHRARLTRQKDGYLWQSHLLQNVPAYVQRRMPTGWQDALRGLPAFICGAGPSLDVSLPRLAPVASLGAVFAADSALRALARQGVTADFAVSIDPAKQPAKCLPTGHAPARVVLSTVSPPEWSTALPSTPSVFLSSNQVTEDWLATQGVARTALTVSESCGSTAVDLARFLGCAPIYLFGLDLAVDAANQAQRHNAAADPTIYRNSGFDPTQQLSTVPGNYAERVPSFAPGHWRALDARIATWPADLVINVNDRGARFRNTTLVHPDNFALSALAAGRKSDALARLSPPDCETSAAPGVLARVRDTGLRAARLLGPLRTALDREGPPSVVRLFRQLLSDQDTSRIFGAFSFKLMPHLLPPLEADVTFWRTLVEEFAQLSASAAQIATE